MADREVQGLAELDALLKTLPVKIEANILRGAVRAGQKVVQEKAQSEVPQRSGKLKRSVRVRTDFKAARRGFVRADVVAGDKDAWYAGLVEFGTGGHYEGSGSSSVRKPYIIRAQTSNGKEVTTGMKRRALRVGSSFFNQVEHPGSRAQPYMRPAAELLDGPALDAFVAYVNKRLPKELAKAGKS